MYLTLSIYPSYSLVKLSMTGYIFLIVTESNVLSRGLYMNKSYKGFGDRKDNFATDRVCMYNYLYVLVNMKVITEAEVWSHMIWHGSQYDKNHGNT